MVSSVDWCVVRSCSSDGRRAPGMVALWHLWRLVCCGCLLLCGGAPTTWRRCGQPATGASTACACPSAQISRGGRAAAALGRPARVFQVRCTMRHFPSRPPERGPAGRGDSTQRTKSGRRRKPVGRERRRGPRRVGAERATPVTRATGTPSPRAGSNGYTTNKNLRRIPAATLQPRLRLKGPEVAAQDLRRERDARLQGYDGHDRDSWRVHVLALQQILQ